MTVAKKYLTAFFYFARVNIPSKDHSRRCDESFPSGRRRLGETKALSALYYTVLEFISSPAKLLSLPYFIFFSLLYRY